MMASSWASLRWCDFTRCPLTTVAKGSLPLSFCVLDWTSHCFILFGVLLVLTPHRDLHSPCACISRVPVNTIEQRPSVLASCMKYQSHTRVNTIGHIIGMYIHHDSIWIPCA